MAGDHRTTEEVLNDHLGKALRGELEEDLRENYAEDVVFVEPSGVFHGHAGLRQATKVLLLGIPGAQFEYLVRLTVGEIGFLVWRATSEDRRIDDGVDTFVVRKGRIVAQTAYYVIKARTA